MREKWSLVSSCTRPDVGRAAGQRDFAVAVSAGELQPRLRGLQHTGSTLRMEFPLRARVHRGWRRRQHPGLSCRLSRPPTAERYQLLPALTRRSRPPRQPLRHASRCHPCVPRYVFDHQVCSVIQTGH